jgi:hypothetical protein
MATEADFWNKLAQLLSTVVTDPDVADKLPKPVAADAPKKDKT